MLFSLLSFVLSAEFALKYKVWPPEVQNDLFGRSVSVSTQSGINRLVIGASYAKPGGKAYIYKYDPINEVYNYDTSIMAPNSSTKAYLTEKSDFATKLFVSDDGKTILIAASKLNVQKSDEINIEIDDTNCANHTEDYKNFTIDGEEVEFISELGGVFIYKIDDAGNWNLVGEQSPTNYAIPQGGYGRSITGTRSLNYFAGAYYNKLVKKVPNIVGETFVSTKQQDGSYKISDPLKRPPQINECYSMRFGGSLSFYTEDKLFVTTLKKSSGLRASESNGGTFIYQRQNDGSWVMNEYINQSTNWNQYGNMVAVANDQLIAVYGQNDVAMKGYCPDQAIEILKKVGNEWSTTPSQVISYSASAGYTIGDMSSCTASDISLLQVSSTHNVTMKTKIELYAHIDDQYKLVQTIYEPEIISELCKGYTDIQGDECTNYKDQHISFPSAFDWDASTCRRFFVGAMSKTGSGGGTKGYKWSRVYGYELNGAVEELLYGPSKKSGLKPGELAGIIVACVVVVIIIIVIVIVVVRKKSKTGSGSGSAKGAESI